MDQHTGCYAHNRKPRINMRDSFLLQYILESLALRRLLWIALPRSLLKCVGGGFFIVHQSEIWFRLGCPLVGWNGVGGHKSMVGVFSLFLVFNTSYRITSVVTLPQISILSTIGLVIFPIMLNWP